MSENKTDIHETFPHKWHNLVPNRTFVIPISSNKIRLYCVYSFMFFRTNQKDNVLQKV